MDSVRLDGKRALVTGAARGIGRAVALSFARAGAEVILLDLALEATALAADRITAF